MTGEEVDELIRELKNMKPSGHVKDPITKKLLREQLGAMYSGDMDRYDKIQTAINKRRRDLGMN